MSIKEVLSSSAQIQSFQAKERRVIPVYKPFKKLHPSVIAGNDFQKVMELNMIICFLSMLENLFFKFFE